MQAIFDMFEDRISELELYFSALNELDRGNLEHKSTDHYFNSEFIKILKANTLLMIYNLVESTVMGGILEIYDKLKSDCITYSVARKEIRDIWFSYRFREVYDQHAHYNSYKSKAMEIINSILAEEVIELTRKATNISGNLDAQQIRNICQCHGIHFEVEQKCRGGIVLETVKEKRNGLAHGNFSFVECGRDYSLLELEHIKDDTILFLRGLLDGMKKYYNDSQYRNNK